MAPLKATRSQGEPGEAEIPAYEAMRKDGRLADRIAIWRRMLRCRGTNSSALGVMRRKNWRAECIRREYSNCFIQ
jgi:hypothetical protein